MRVRVGLIALLLLLVGTGCAGSAGSELAAGDLKDLAGRTALSERSFTSISRSGGHALEVEAVVEDDYRYSATVSLDGRTVYEEVVVDDHRWLRLVDSGPVAPRAVLDGLAAADPGWAALMAGGWVVDPAGAPPEFTAGAERTKAPLTPALVLSRVRFFDELELDSLNLREYNPKAIYYLPKDDKFDLHPSAGTRFDHLPAAYDPNKVFTDLESAQPHFRYVAVWADAGGWNRYETLMELPDPADETFEEMYTQLGRAGSRRLLDLLRSGSEGLRFSETWTFGTLAPGDEVVEPSAATPVDLTKALEALATRVAAEPHSLLHGEVD